ncbi:hypothetical protein [Streptomyces nigrescens]|uniref:Uncharacterized protein n=1 Tax=Streptomyces nigrescens TaxID=1920 RepID=A0ABY7J8J1_STRNI|nr:hypothetical protein [Streptomyces nigrescens]WAU06066.1 hypothetical protein STRNI_004520 [Streptomyces nigrescens]WAU09967.1 hypothetical protein STRNI_008253 [Streptomyces nigrescens]
MSRVAPLAEAHVEQGYLVAVLWRRSTNRADEEPPKIASAPHIVPTAHAAIRAIRVSLRTHHVFGMTPREQRRAVEWSETGWVHALATLRNGDTSAFTVVLSSGGQAEWSARPITYLSLSTCLREGPSA